MRRLAKAITALFLALLMGTLLPVQVFADTPEYICDIRLGEGNTKWDAVNGLNGFTVLKYEDGSEVNLNENAGSSESESKGQKFVALGYKTTKNKDDAITDIALMNMKGGYSVRDYDALMETDFKENIMPFVENFKAAIEEYRVNYKSSNAKNQKRAQYTHDLLNKLIDDDTGKPLGDLLLNKTKYEMGDAAYNALSANEKKNHADIATIIMQANGIATLTIENAITRASDTGDDTWIDRMCGITFDDLLDETGLPPSKARKQVFKKYDDDASTIVDMWGEFVDYLDGYTDAKATLENYDDAAVTAAFKAYDEMAEDISEEEKSAIENAYTDALEKYNQAANAAETVAIYEKLNETEYDGGTLLEFFTQPKADLEEDSTAVYPLVAALSEGQKAGLEFVSLKELVSMALGDPDKLNINDFNKLDTVSVFDGVDRGIYKKGGVGLTSDAERKNAAERPVEDYDSTVNALFYCSAVAGVMSVASAVAGFIISFKVADYANALDRGAAVSGAQVTNAFRMSSLCTKLCVAVPLISAIVFIVLTAEYVNYHKQMYNIEFDAIPRYMVDVKDIVGYNSRGEKVVLKNQDAYYRAAVCNRDDYNSAYDVLGVVGDINGTVCKQWVALYFAKNRMQSPILAKSIKAVRGSSTIPADYKTGIHMFGTDVAENFNNPLYVWNSNAPEIYVYYKTDNAATAAGSGFTAGTLAVSGIAGIALGAIITALYINITKKKNGYKVKTA